MSSVGSRARSVFYIYWIIIRPEAWKSKQKVGHKYELRIQPIRIQISPVACFEILFQVITGNFCILGSRKIINKKKLTYPSMLIIHFHFPIETSQWTIESEGLVKYYVYVALIWRNTVLRNGDYTVFQFEIKFVLKDSLAMGRPRWNKFGWIVILTSQYYL